MPRLLIVLQNPYDKDGLERGWNATTWAAAYRSSRTGQRLARALPHAGGWKLHHTNANPRIGQGPDAKLPADLPHLRRVLKRVRPDFVLSCGKEAEKAAVSVWDGPLLAIPHPAFRLLTNDLLHTCCRMLESWGIFESMPHLRKRSWPSPIWRVAVRRPRLAMRQERGNIRYDELSPDKNRVG